MIRRRDDEEEDDKEEDNEEEDVAFNETECLIGDAANTGENVLTWVFRVT